MCPGYFAKCTCLLNKPAKMPAHPHNQKNIYINFSKQVIFSLGTEGLGCYSSFFFYFILFVIKRSFDKWLWENLRCKKWVNINAAAASIWLCLLLLKLSRGPRGHGTVPNYLTLFNLQILAHVIHLIGCFQLPANQSHFWLPDSPPVHLSSRPRGSSRPSQLCYAQLLTANRGQLSHPAPLQLSPPCLHPVLLGCSLLYLRIQNQRCCFVFLNP